MLENLSILLDDDEHCSASTITNLPANEDVMKSFVPETVADNMAEVSVMFNELCVVI